ncbi:MAG: DUF167 domain-containing protein [Victivallaceae bacterium]|nr:DUF167 domain-containing protein [Victivallaceae bacterium]
METTPFDPVPGGLRLALHLQPGAKRTAFAGIYGDKVKLAVQSPPVDGRANDAAIRFLAAHFGVAARDVEIVSGAASRDKRFFIRGDADVLLKKMKDVLQ